MKRHTHLKISIFYFLVFQLIFSIQPAFSAYEFSDIECLADIQTKDICNVSFYSNFFSIRFTRSGRSLRIPYSSIQSWNYSDASLRKADFSLAERIGLVGLFFKKIEQNHVFAITYLDQFGDRQYAVFSFDDKQYVLSMMDQLPPSKEIK